jgi:hypothetical protein
MNFLDERGCSWDIAKDVRTPSEAREFAYLLVPPPTEGDKRGGNNNFFENAARTMAVIVLEALQRKTSLTWTLLDFVHFMGNRPDLEDLLADSPDLLARLKNLTQRNDTSADIGSEIETIIDPLRLAGELSRFSPYPPISFRQWVLEESILIFPAIQNKIHTLTPVYRIMLDFLFKELLSIKDSDPYSFNQRTWVFLDELPQIKGLKSLSSLMSMGASKKVSVVIGFQTLSLMRDAFGDNESRSIIDLCSYRVFLNIEGSETAEFASKQIGGFEVSELEHGRSMGQSETSTQSWQSGTSTGTSRSLSEGKHTGRSESRGTGRSYPTALFGMHGLHYQDSYNDSRGTSSGSNHSSTQGESATSSSSHGGSKANGQNRGESQTIRRMARDVFLPSQFMHALQLADREKGVEAICVNPYTGVYPLHFRADYLFEGDSNYPPALLPIDPDVVTEMPRDETLIYKNPYSPPQRKRGGRRPEPVAGSEEAVSGSEKTALDSVKPAEAVALEGEATPDISTVVSERVATPEPSELPHRFTRRPRNL